MNDILFTAYHPLYGKDLQQLHVTIGYHQLRLLMESCSRVSIKQIYRVFSTETQLQHVMFHDMSM